MSLIEIEIAAGPFWDLMGTLVTAAPIPVPTLAPLGDTRLISALEWGTLHPAPARPGTTVPVGALYGEAPLVIRHVSVAELQANHSAAGTATTATAWLQLSGTAGHITIDWTGVAITGAGIQAFSPPIRLADFDAAEGTHDVATIVSSALVATEALVVFRFGTSPTDDLLQLPANHLASGGGNWLIRVSQDALVEFLLRALQGAAADLPAATEVEDAPSAGWFPPSGLPGGPSEWAAMGSLGIVQRDACPGVFEDTDISVTLSAILTFGADLDRQRLTIGLALSTDVSDWDSFRCWLGSGALASVALGALTGPVVTVVAGVGSLVGIGEMLRHAGGAPLGDAAPARFVEVSRTTSSATFRADMRLPQLPLSSGITAETGADGLLVRGTGLFFSSPHAREFIPSFAPLTGGWQRQINCALRQMTQSFHLPAVLVTDAIVNPLSGAVITRLPVVVFPTSVALPPSAWQVDVPGPATHQTVTVRARGGAPTPGQGGAAIIHTSAGIRYYDITPIPAHLAPSSANEMRVLNAYCDTFRVPSRVIAPQELTWVDEPPPYHYGHPAVRQWQLALASLPRAATLAVHAVDERGRIERDLVVVRASRTGSITFEVVTDAATHLQLELTGTDEPVTPRLIQRWLLPLQVLALPAPARALARSGDTVGVLAGEVAIHLSAATGARRDAIAPPTATLHADAHGVHVREAHPKSSLVYNGLDDFAPPTSARISADQDRRDDAATAASKDAHPGARDRLPPMSLTLPDRRVVAVHGNQLLFAAPAAPVAFPSPLGVEDPYMPPRVEQT